MSDSELKYPMWQSPCVDAIAELDPKRLMELLSAAETAIYTRLRELETSPDGAEERMAITHAMKILRGIKKDRLNVA